MSRLVELFMEDALHEPQRAIAPGEVPVGALFVRDGPVVGRGCNRPVTDHDPTAHAEVQALREAGHVVGNYRLLDCDLYVTVEPCAMCAEPLTTRESVDRVMAPEDAKAGAVHSMLQVVNHPKLNHLGRDHLRSLSCPLYGSGSSIFPRQAPSSVK
jgi:tRNA(adenine34) deaminase